MKDLEASARRSAFKPASTATIRLGAVLVAFGSIAGAAAAADGKIGGTALRLPPPAGYCELDPVLASDAPMIGRLHATMTKAGNRLLIISADCACGCSSGGRCPNT